MAAPTGTLYVLTRVRTGDTITVPPSALHRTVIAMTGDGYAANDTALAMAAMALLESGQRVHGTYRREPVTIHAQPATIATIEDEAVARLCPISRT
jgi:oxalate decarboxylase/phosphoglucose isomerase-like protein (cupin superfamily)